MQVKYALRTDIVTNEDNQKHNVYGINAVDTLGNILESYEDIFFDRRKADEFIDLCNKEKLELIHLPDVIEDILG